MMNIEALTDNLHHWMGNLSESFHIDIDHHQCELLKTQQGVQCVFDLDISAQHTLSLELLLKLTRTSLSCFSGIPAISPDGNYVLTKWLSTPSLTQQETAENLTQLNQDCQTILSVIENLSTQVVVWKELLADIGRVDTHMRPPMTNAINPLPNRLIEQLNSY